MALAFYSNEEAVLSRKTAINPDQVVQTKAENLDEFYEIERCVRHIKEQHCKRVGLQFPDSLIVDAVSLARQLEERTDAKIYILADTSYGHCDIDEISANHVDADLIIHYGESALTPSAKIPTIFVFGRHPSTVDQGSVCQAFHECFPNKAKTRIVFLHHVSCHYIAEKISDTLLPDYPYLSVGSLNIPGKPGGASGQNVGEEEEENILKDLCTKSCPGCPCRLEKGGDDQTKSEKASGENGTKRPAEKLSNGTKMAASSTDSETIINDDTKMDTTDHNENLAKAESSGTLPNIKNGALAEYRTTAEPRKSSSTEEKPKEDHQPDCQDYETGYFTIPLETDKQLEDYSIFYLGPKDSESLKNLMMTHPTNEVHVYDPANAKCEKLTSNTNRQLMKRYYLVEKAKDAKTVGILAGTMGMAGYLECLNHMKKIGKAAGKKTYTFIVGKLNPAKLANFPEIEIFVLIANRENNIIDSSDFYRPVITPYEFEVACNPNREWSGNYVTDFRDILQGGRYFVEFPSEKSEIEETTMSLVTGSIRTNAEIEGSTAAPATETAVAQRNQKTDLSVFDPNSAAHHLSERSWKGLEQKLGETTVTKAKKGRSGLAASYSHEPKGSMDF